jgi:hypothetical protein
VLVEGAKTGAANHMPPLLAVNRQRRWRPPLRGHRLIRAAASRLGPIEPTIEQMGHGSYSLSSVGCFTLISRQFTLMGQISSLLGLCNIPCFLTREFRS